AGGPQGHGPAGSISRLRDPGPGDAELSAKSGREDGLRHGRGWGEGHSGTLRPGRLQPGGVSRVGELWLLPAGGSRPLDSGRPYGLGWRTTSECERRAVVRDLHGRLAKYL